MYKKPNGFSKALLPALLTLALIGCGGSGSTTNLETDDPDDGPADVGSETATITGTVMLSSLVSGASVCADENRNGVCDVNEPNALSDETGGFTLELSEGVTSAPLVAELNQASETASTQSLARPAQAETNMDRLMTPAGQTTISPLTTLIQSNALHEPHRDIDQLEREYRVMLGLEEGGVDLFADVSTNTALSNAATQISCASALIAKDIELGAGSGININENRPATQALATTIIRENIEAVKEACLGSGELTFEVDVADEQLTATSQIIADAGTASITNARTLADQNTKAWSLDMDGGGSFYVVPGAFLSSECNSGEHCIVFNFDNDRIDVASFPTTDPSYWDTNWEQTPATANDSGHLMSNMLYSFEDVSVVNTATSRSIASLVPVQQLSRKLSSVKKNCDPNAETCVAHEQFLDNIAKTVDLESADVRHSVSFRFPNYHYLTSAERDAMFAYLRGSIADGSPVGCPVESATSWDDLIGEQILPMGDTSTPNEDWWTLGKEEDTFTLSRQGNTVPVQVTNEAGAVANEEFLFFQYDGDVNLIMLKHDGTNCQGVADIFFTNEAPWSIYDYTFLNKSGMDKVVQKLLE